VCKTNPLNFEMALQQYFGTFKELLGVGPDKRNTGIAYQMRVGWGVSPANNIKRRVDSFLHPTNAIRNSRANALPVSSGPLHLISTELSVLHHTEIHRTDSRCTVMQHHSPPSFLFTCVGMEKRKPRVNGGPQLSRGLQGKGGGNKSRKKNNQPRHPEMLRQAQTFNDIQVKAALPCLLIDPKGLLNGGEDINFLLPEDEPPVIAPLIRLPSDLLDDIAVPRELKHVAPPFNTVLDLQLGPSLGGNILFDLRNVSKLKPATIANKRPTQLQLGPTIDCGILRDAVTTAKERNRLRTLERHSGGPIPNWSAHDVLEETNVEKGPQLMFNLREEKLKQRCDDILFSRRNSDGTYRDESKVPGLYFRTPVSADIPNRQTLFKTHCLPSSYELYDPKSTPFCGLAAIDLGLGRHPNFKLYRDMLTVRGCIHDLDAPYYLGTLRALSDYAAENGVNLAIYNAHGTLMTTCVTLQSFPWVLLSWHTAWDMDERSVRLGHDLVRPNKVETEQQAYQDLRVRLAKGRLEQDPGSYVGHVFLIVGDTSEKRLEFDMAKFNFSTTHEVKLSWWMRLILCYLFMSFVNFSLNLASWTLPLSCLGMFWIFFITCICACGHVSADVHRSHRVENVTYAQTNDDTRDVRRRKDELKAQEAYGTVVSESMLKVRLFNKRTIISSQMFEELVPSLTRRMVNRKRVVALGCSQVIMNEMSSSYLTDAKMPISGFSTVRGINFDANKPNINIDSISYLNDYADYVNSCKSGLEVSGLPQNEPFVTYSVNGLTSLISDVDAAALNQVVGMDGEVVNHIKNGRWRAGDIKRRIAYVNPIGGLKTDSGATVCGGLAPTTDSASVLSAFIGRAMNKNAEMIDQPLLKELVEVSKIFIDELLAKSEMPRMTPNINPVEANIDAFVTAYTGKRSKSWIDNNVRDYRSYLSNTLGSKATKKFISNSFFVKFEHSVKKVDGKLWVRPRGIMTMSQLMMFECAQAIELLHKFYDTEVKYYQVKGMSNSEMASIICDMTEEEMTVTDMSSFESSITYMHREIEDYLMKKLAEASGIPELYSNYKKHTTECRELVTPWGTFMIQSRCSGDFWTSAFNGIMNLCLVHWQFFRRSKHSEVLTIADTRKRVADSYRGFSGLFCVAEGDDGLVRSGVINELEMNAVFMKFSSAVSGTMPGDVDFLRARWVDGKRYVNIGRSLCTLLAVKKAGLLSKGKRLYLLRFAALSLYHNSPGHPVLTGLINFIERRTRHVHKFKSAARYYDSWKTLNTVISTTKFPRDIQVDESMRPHVAAGAIGFPPISYEMQIRLESNFEAGCLYIGSALNEYEDIEQRMLATTGGLNMSSDNFLAAIEKLELDIEGVYTTGLGDGSSLVRFDGRDESP